MRCLLKDAILGLAVGDALGVPVEFCSRKKLKEHPVDDYRDGGIHDQPPGTWSDDTSLTLCLLESLCSLGRLDLVDVAERFVEWFYGGYWTPHGDVFDVGSTTKRAIVRLAKLLKKSRLSVFFAKGRLIET